MPSMQAFTVDQAGKLYMQVRDKENGGTMNVPLGPVSAYALACQQGFEGTLDQWLLSLHEYPSGGTPGQFIVRAEDGGESLYEWKTLEPATETTDGLMSAEDKGVLKRLQDIQVETSDGKITIGGKSTTEVGGIKAGTDFSDGVSITEIFSMMLRPDIPPTVLATYNLNSNTLYNRADPPTLTSVDWAIQAVTNDVTSYDVAIVTGADSSPAVESTSVTDIIVDGIEHLGTAEASTQLTDTCKIVFSAHDAGDLVGTQETPIYFGDPCYIGVSSGEVTEESIVAFDSYPFVSATDSGNPEFSKFIHRPIVATVTTNKQKIIIGFKGIDSGYEVYDQNGLRITDIFTSDTTEDYRVLSSTVSSTNDFKIYFYPYGKEVQ